VKQVQIDIPFPAPIKEGTRNYWTLGSIRRWQAAKAGLPEPASAVDDDNWLPSSRVREMLGGVSQMWLYRRINGDRPKAAA
jgi:hypothetical protein